MLVFFLLVALAFADWPIDFDTVSTRGVGDSTWLDEGSYTADISDRDLSAHAIEFTFLPVHNGHSCVYSVWLNDVKVMYGNIRTSMATIVPTLAGSVNNSAMSESAITVMVSGCYLARYAMPYAYGWQGDSALYIHTFYPEAQVGTPYGFDKAQFPPPSSYPSSFESFSTFESEVFSEGNGWSQFSSQANDWKNPQGWWYTADTSVTNPTGGYGHFLLDVTDVEGFNDTDSNFAVEFQWFTRAIWQYTDFYLCNATAGDCTASGNGGPWWYFNEFYAESQSWEYSVMDEMEYPHHPNTQTDWYRHYLIMDMQAYPTGMEPGVVFAETYDGALLLPPYLKIWNLDSAFWSDPMHVIVDMRNDIGSDCDILCDNQVNSYGAMTQISYEAEWMVGTIWPFDSCSTVPTATFGYLCGRDPAVLNAATCTKDTINSIDLNKGTVLSSGEVTVTGFSMPNGAYIVGFNYDTGFPYASGGTTGCNGAYIYSYFSAYDVNVNGASVGSITNGAVGQGGLGRSTEYGAPYAFHIGTQTGDIKLELSSWPDMSMKFWPFLVLNGFAADKCNVSDCQNGATCADQRGSDQCVLSGQPKMYEGQFAENLFTHCLPDTCMNGGACQENAYRTYNAELFGVGAVDNATTCDCSVAVSPVDASYHYWGEFCQYPSPCDVAPCLNGGLCVEAGDSDFTCDCSATASPHTTNVAYSGDRCEIPMNTPCDLNPCLNGGTCTPDDTASAGFTCSTCQDGWTGHTCEIPPVDNCLTAPDQCGKYGICIPSVDASANYVQCVCLGGWSGSDCQTAPSVCDVLACQNEGVCVALNDGVVAACLCVDPWVGDKCQWNATVFAGASTSSVSIFGALFLGALALLF